MKYMGSKSRIAKDIVPIIQKYLDDYKIDTYIEPFCGGCNVIDKIQCNTRVASDVNKYLIELFINRNQVSDLPEIVTKELYDECRKAYYGDNFSKYEQWYIAGIGFFASYSGRFYDGGFNGTSFLEGKSKRNYYDEAKRNFLTQIPALDGIIFQHGDYEELYSGQEDCLIYCDIPYEGVKQYNTSRNFDYDRFWRWAEQMSRKNIVLVSEYKAPDKWNSLWQKGLIKTMNHGNNVKSIEKLFKLSA